jgi:hypothetical protein
MFNKRIKGSSYIFRHFLYSSIPIFFIYYFSLSQIEPMKWFVVLPAMYLISVNDYNRFFTLFKQPLPYFIILVLLSIICGMFPVIFLWLSILCIIFRIIMAFNITTLSKNSQL